MASYVTEMMKMKRGSARSLRDVSDTITVVCPNEAFNVESFRSEDPCDIVATVFTRTGTLMGTLL